MPTWEVVIEPDGHIQIGRSYYIASVTSDHSLDMPFAIQGPPIFHDEDSVILHAVSTTSGHTPIPVIVPKEMIIPPVQFPLPPTNATQSKASWTWIKHALSVASCGVLRK